MRHLITTTLLMLFLANINAQLMEVAGEITENTVWEADTILITDNVLIPEFINLTISPGVTVLAYQQKHLEVNGSLTAEGSFESPILFSAFDTIGFSDTITINGTWGGIHFMNLNEQEDSSILDYCIIEYGGAYGEEELDKKGGGIFIDQSSKIRISNSIIQNNFAEESGGGIYLHENSVAIISNNLIQNNKAGLEGGGIMSLENSFPVIENNIIIKNLALRCSIIGCAGRGGGVLITTLSDNDVSIIRSNIICNNYSGSGGGVYESSFNTQVVSNIICNNRGSGIFTGNSISSSYYVNNTIVNNRGGGIWTFSENINIINNIVQNNFLYSGNFFRDTFDIRYKEGTSSDNFLNNNVGTATEFGDHSGNEDLTSIGLGNINVMPMFVNPSEGNGLLYSGYNVDWSLILNDADIDAGTTEGILEMLPTKDAYGNSRILGETIDIGAVEFDQISVISERNENDLVKIYPNPFSGQVWIEINDFLGEKWHLSVWSENGQILHSFDVQHSISTVNADNWPNGVYFIEGKNKNGKHLFVEKIIKGR